MDWCHLSVEFPAAEHPGTDDSGAVFGQRGACKVSEWSSHSAPRACKRFLRTCCHRVATLPDLVQIITGFGETGAALVRSGVDKIFSPDRCRMVGAILEGSVQNLTPVVLELGGKDPLIVCDDADPRRPSPGRWRASSSARDNVPGRRADLRDGWHLRSLHRARGVRPAQQLRQGDPPVAMGPTSTLAR